MADSALISRPRGRLSEGEAERTVAATIAGSANSTASQRAATTTAGAGLPLYLRAAEGETQHASETAIATATQAQTTAVQAAAETSQPENAELERPRLGLVYPPPSAGAAEGVIEAESGVAKTARRQEGETPAPAAAQAAPAPVGVTLQDAAAPAAPSPHRAIAPAIAAVRQRAAGARKHAPAATSVASAQAAAIQPRTEQMRAAATQTVADLDAVGAETVKRQAFKAKLRQAIEAATPKPRTESDANRVMSEGAAQASSTLRGELATERDAAAGPLKAAAHTEASPSSQPAPPKADLKREPIGAAPAPISGALAAPAPLAPERLDYSSDRQPTDRAMAENNVRREQLEQGNDPEFSTALEARSAAEGHEAQAESHYRQEEWKVQDQARDAAHSTLATDLAAMHGARGAHLGGVLAKQVGTSAKSEAERQRVTDTINGIKDATRRDVEAILGSMDTEASRIFEDGLRRAEEAYRSTFEEEKGGFGTWITTWGSDWEQLIETSLAKARVEYLHQVDIAIDQVADLVDGKLQAAKQRVADGRKEVENFVKGLDESIRGFGDQAEQDVSAAFDAMTADIDQRADVLVNMLVDYYKSSYERMSAMEERLREENKSLWQRAYDATVGLIRKIFAFKDMLMGVLAHAAHLVVDIVSDPIGFLGNLVNGVMSGLKNFVSNIGAHLKKGLMDWLFGALAGAGLQLPENFDLKGILGIVLQILGLTYANFRARAVAIVGESVVAALEQAAEVFKVFVTDGVGGLWRFIKEKVEDLRSMVLDAIFDWVKDKVIIAGITWIIGLLNPASAFFKACKAIYDIVSFFMNRGSQIIALVNAVIGSIASIVKGNISAAAGLVENALAKGVPVAIGFLAGLLGLGDPAKPVRETIEKAKSPVNRAIDWVIGQAVKAVRAARMLVKDITRPKQRTEQLTAKEAPSEAQDPATQARIDAGLVHLQRTEATKAKDGRLSRNEAEELAAAVKREHPVFQILEVKEGDGRHWLYHWKANPTGYALGGEMEPTCLAIRQIDVKHDKLFASRHTSGEAFELGVEATIIKDETIPELVEEFDVPIQFLARGHKDYGKPSAQYKARAKSQRGHRAGGEQRQPDVSLEIVGPKGAVKQVVVMEITLVHDFTPTRRDPIHKVDQFEYTIKLLKSKYGSEVPIRFMFFVPEPPSPATEKFILDAIRAERVPNIEVVWNFVNVTRSTAKSG